MLPLYSLSQNYLDYYNRLNAGDWALVSENDTSEFIKQYEEAFYMFEPFIMDRINLINMYAAVKSWDKITGQLVKVLNKGYPLNGRGLQLGAFTSTAAYQEVKDREKDYFNTFLTDLDFDLYKKMLRLSTTDQYLSVYSPSQTDIDTFWYTMREKVFLKNINILLETTKQVGYPGERRFGFLAFGEGVGTILVHNPIIFDDPKSPQNATAYNFVKPSKADSATINKLRDILKPMVAEGLVSRNEYIQLYDSMVQMLIGTQKIQYYGQGYNRQSHALIPIWDIKNVDKRRAEIGLAPLYQYAKLKGLELPFEYIMPEQKKK
jgi:hypothetical protein